MLTVASCQKELAPETVKTGVEKTLTFSFDAAKTQLDGTKTVWCAGDSIWVSDGTSVDKIYVPEEADGEATFTYSTSIFDGLAPLYAVYPCSSAKSIKEGVLTFNIPSDQDGLFESSNICVATSTDFKFAMKNVTGLLKISVVDNIETVVVSSNAVISGEFTVSDFETLALTPVTTTGTTINLTAAGLGGDYYIAVAPGTYSQFGLLALTTDGQFQKKDATASNTIARSQIATLGEIGSDLTGLEGDGTESNPYVIPHVGAMTAFAAMVNGGETFEGKFVKVTADFDGVTLPAGYYKSADDQASFKGNFDGQNHTIGLAVTSNSAPTQGGYLGLFGFAEAPAIIENVKVNGTVTGNSGNCVGGVVGCLKGVEASMDSCFVVNCVNDAVVSSKGSHTGGVVGWAGNYCHILNCQNNAAITSSTSNLGGIVGYLNFYSEVAFCNNKGNITNTQNRNPASQVFAPTGGIAGIVQKLSVVNDCVNDGDIYGNGVVGGVMGAYQARNANSSTASTLWGGYGVFGWTPASNSDLIGSAANHNNLVNNGTVDGQVTVGGIIGGSYYGNTLNCVNNGEVKGVKLVGGILGWTQNAASKFDVNNGKVTGTGMLVGGIMAYKYWSSVNGSVNNADVTGGQLVGGIVGGSHKQSNVDNAVNYGKVTATATPKVVDEEAGTVSGLYAAGGIIGGAWSNQQNAVAMRNCINYGDVVYVNPCPNPHVGGLFGYATAPSAGANVQNSVNVGIVSCAGTAVEGATEGGVGGYNTNAQCAVTNCFFKTATSANAFGFNANEAAQAYEFNASGDVISEAKPVIEGSTYDTAVDALNAWRKENVYYYEWSWDETNKVPVLSAPTE